MALLLRAASFTEASVLTRLNSHVQSLHARLEPTFFKPTPDPEELEAYFDDVLNNPDNKVIFAEEDAEALGYLWFQVQRIPETPFTWPRRRLYIYQIVVVESSRRGGIGSSLLSYAERRAQEDGIDTIALDSWSSNVVAQDFFRARGFSTLTTGCEKRVAIDSH